MLSIRAIATTSRAIIVTVAIGTLLGGCQKSGNQVGEVANEEIPKGSAMNADADRTPGTVPPGKNRLALEQSPYLLQHQDNPVDWYPWGEEAFAAARDQDKPIFLSIGYSTCHWCHVMEHESFENEEIAALMNNAFICIKVDREERPDIDNIYMAVCQMMTQRGGWPLTILMTAEKKPFFAGTYIPPDGLRKFIPQVRQVWLTQREQIHAQTDQIMTALEQSTRTEAGDLLTEAELTLAYTQLSERYDRAYGGFGAQPKFPTPHNLLFLLRYWKRSGDANALEMVEKTLTEMRRGGMYDHVGFGFHRYSTDKRWFLPHFEKMLYDQAMLLMAYTEAWQATGKDLYRETAEEIITYLARDMTDSAGGFYSAEDADSEGEEGKFYLWSEQEIRELLGDDADLYMEVFGFEEGGNYHEESSGERSNRNIPYLARPLSEQARIKNMDETELRATLERCREKLFEERETRIRPGLDDKVLTDWNGLMIAALAKAGRAFGERRHTDMARNAADFLLRDMLSDGQLLHRYRAGDAAIRAMADDYAFLIWGLLDLYESTFDTRYLRKAIELQGVMIEDFWDVGTGGFFFGSDDGETLIVRQKEVYDGASPSANSVSMLNLIRLGRITADSSWEQRARDIGRAFNAQVVKSPSIYTQMMCAVDFAVGPSFEIVIAGVIDDEGTQAMLTALERMYVPNKVVVMRADNDDSIVKLAPYTREQRTIDGKATVYVCRNYACELPTTDIDEMLGMLARP